MVICMLELVMIVLRRIGIVLVEVVIVSVIL